MLRISTTHLQHPIPTTAVNAFSRLSLILPTLNFLSSSPPNLHLHHHHRISTFALLPRSRRIPNSHPLPLFTTERLSRMAAAYPRLNPSASFSAGSESRDYKEIMVQHLLVKENDLKLLLELQRRISEGEDLSDLAVEHSICPSKEEGGMLGWVRRGQMVPEFEEAAFNAPINKVVRCKTTFGWHLLQVISEREEPVFQEIEPNELHAKMQDPQFLQEAQLIDVREPDEVAQASLPGFEVLPLRQFGSWGPEINTKFDSQKDTYVMCHHGMRSLQVAKWLQAQGFHRVYNVSGGIHAYATKADSSIPTY